MAPWAGGLKAGRRPGRVVNLLVAFAWLPTAAVVVALGWLLWAQLRFERALSGRLHAADPALLTSPWVRVERVLQAPAGSTYLPSHLLWQMQYVPGWGMIPGQVLAPPQEHVPHAPSPTWPPTQP